MKKNWFFIILLTISSLALAGTAAYFSIFGLAKLFYGAGLGIIILASVLEFSKLVTVSYVYRYWNHIANALKIYYILGIIFIMLLTSIGVYGYLASAYQNTANKIEVRDSQIKISENKKSLFVSQLDRINKSIESSNNRINTISNVRDQQEKRLSTLYDKNSVSSARRTENQISGSDDQIKTLNLDITEKMKQSNIINDSISYYDQKIMVLKTSDVSNEVGPLKYLADLTGYSMNRIVNILVLLIIFVFDPMAITLLIGVNQLSMMGKSNSDSDKIEMPKLFRKKKKEDEIEEESEKIVEVKKTTDNVINNDRIKNEYVYKEKYVQDITENEQIKKEENVIVDRCLDGYVEEKINLNISDIKEGMKVYHNTFGNGIILKMDNEKGRVFINFESGIKELSPEYANLMEIKCVKKYDVESVQYLDFFEDDPEIQEIIARGPNKPIQTEIVEPEIVVEPEIEPIVESEPDIIPDTEMVIEPEQIVDVVVENESEKKTNFFQRIWKGKRII